MVLGNIEGLLFKEIILVFIICVLFSLYIKKKWRGGVGGMNVNEWFFLLGYGLVFFVLII